MRTRACVCMVGKVLISGEASCARAQNIHLKLLVRWDSCGFSFM